MIVLYGILLLVLVLLAIAVIRAAMLKPTPALTAEPPKADAARARAYAEKLAAMVRQETVSSRFDPSRSKFEKVQESLPALFPRVFAACQVAHPGAGLVLRLPGKGSSKKEPILLMSHHDVVAATEQGWEHAPFSGDIDAAGRVWGRGTVDTKGSLMCELQALEELLKRSMSQSFVPVVDDRGAFVGIVTRQNIIRRLTTPRVEKEEPPTPVWAEGAAALAGERAMAPTPAGSGTSGKS